MAIVGNLPKALGLTTRKVVAIQAAITGTGAIITPLTNIDPGSAQVTVQDAAITVPTDVASVSSVTDAPGTVNVVVVELEAAANAIETAARQVGLLCTGN